MKASTVNRKLASLSSLMNWGVESGSISSNPAAKMKYVKQAAQSKFDLLDLALLTRYQKIFVVHDDDKAGDIGREYIASLKAISPRIESIAPPAHDLTDYWRLGGDVRAWAAGYVVAALQETTHPRWMKVLKNAKRELQEVTYV